MNYAIIDASGKQFWVEKGKFYDLDYINGLPGDIINLNRVLLIAQEGIVKIGKPCLENSFVKVSILKHLKGRKITVFKMKPKKNSRSKQGHRQQLTRVLVREIC